MSSLQVSCIADPLDSGHLRAIFQLCIPYIDAFVVFDRIVIELERHSFVTSGRERIWLWTIITVQIVSRSSTVDRLP